MRRPSATDLLCIAGPPLLLAGLGLTHPMDLTMQSASWWRNLHVVLLPIFPLLVLGPWIVVRHEHRALRWLVGVLGFAYAIFYTALDVLAGIGAGALKQAGAGPDWTSVMFGQGGHLSHYGVWALLASTVVAAAVALRRAGPAAAPGAVFVVVAAWLFLDSHIYWPKGGLAMIAFALGWTLLTLALANRAEAGPVRTAAAATTPPGP